MDEIGGERLEHSAGGVIFRSRGNLSEILLIKDSYGNWGFPKGHQESGETKRETALRECREETGLARLEVLGSLGSTDWYFQRGGSVIHKYCDYFLIVADPDEEPAVQRSEGIQDVEWLAAEDAPARITYENARRMLERGLEELRGHLGKKN